MTSTQPPSGPGFYSLPVGSPSSSDSTEQLPEQACEPTGRHHAEEPDMVNHPPHYRRNGMQAIDVLEAFELMDDAYLANTVKYILRHKWKGGEEDLKKAAYYLNRRLNVKP